MRSLSLFLALVLLAAPVLGQVELQHTIILDTTPKPCNGQNSHQFYANTYGRTAFIKSGYFWEGAGRGIRADIGAAVYLIPDVARPFDSIRLRDVMWDRYQDPRNHDDQVSDFDFGENYFTFAPNSALMLEWGCTLVGAQDGPPINAGIHGWLWPWDYFFNIQGHLQQARLYVTFDRPTR